MNKVIKPVKAFLGIAIIGMLIMNNIVFLHSHKLPNGYIVIHAHPFNKNKDSAPFKMHHHTQLEFFLLHNIYILFFIGIFILGAFALKQSKAFFNYIPPVFLNYSKNHVSKRGPPISNQCN